jgi:cysteinyl-tRNA synthetase
MLLYPSFFFKKKKNVLYRSLPLSSSLREKQVAIHTALCDSINTPTAMSELMELINKSNIYLSNGRNNINVYVLENVAKYVTKMLRVFGVVGNSASEEIGFGVSEQQNVGNVSLF